MLVSDASASAVNLTVAVEEINEAAIENFCKDSCAKIDDGYKAVKKAVDEKEVLLVTSL